jgi:site-specific DNA-methyltransferase (adenine-specific)
LVLLRKPSQHVTQKVYAFVPTQDWTKQWTDADLYKKYGLAAEEIEFIEKIVRPMSDSIADEVSVGEDDDD